jgi:hypothetical protein
MKIALSHTSVRLVIRPSSTVNHIKVSGLQTIAPFGTPAVVPHAVPNPIEPDSDAMCLVQFFDLAS